MPKLSGLLNICHEFPHDGVCGVKALSQIGDMSRQHLPDMMHVRHYLFSVDGAELLKHAIVERWILVCARIC